MIHRKADEWIDNHYRTTKKALLLTGARQVGKTYAVRRAAERLGWHLVEMNFLLQPETINIVKGAGELKEVLLRISAYANEPLDWEKTLIFFDVGLGYLTLNRQSNTLSGGESQRINLTTSLGSSLVGSLYILDEPSIGMHARDTQRLIGVLKKLQAIGNTVVVVEHDEEIIRAADHIIDVGPEAGTNGGTIVWEGSPKAKKGEGKGHTHAYLTGLEKIAAPETRRPWNQFIKLNGCRMHNLKGIDVTFPLNCMTVVTGVSGSGKSSLVRGILYPALKRKLGGVADTPGEHSSLEGDWKHLHHVEMIDQNPIGKSTRSNPATYTKAYEAIRQLMAEQPLAKQLHHIHCH